jgi:hypothetical protein
MLQPHDVMELRAAHDINWNSFENDRRSNKSTNLVMGNDAVFLRSF